MTAPGSPLPAAPRISPFRLVGTLTAAGALAGLALVFAYEATLPRIQANKAAALEAAVMEVLQAPARYETLYLEDGRLVAEPVGDRKKLERVYRGYDAEGRPMGFAIAAAAPGFQDVIRLIFGYDAASGKLLGMRVLESKETPGLGDKIEKDDDFVDQWRSREARPEAEEPLVGVKAGTKREAFEVDMITGATISSRTVIKIINGAIRRWRPLLREVQG